MVDPTLWTRAERHALDRLDRPGRIQDFLDATPYSTEARYRCPRTVLREGRAHCMDGALLAAAALRRQGHRPRLVDLRAVRDDDHVLAVFQRRGRWGAIAKSNCTGLRFREPVHHSLRELVMTYFEVYFNVAGEKTLREYSRPLDLARLDHLGWATEDAAVDEVVARLDGGRHYPVLAPAEVRALLPVDPRSRRAGFLGADPAGLKKVEPRAPRPA